LRAGKPREATPNGVAPAAYVPPADAPKYQAGVVPLYPKENRTPAKAVTGWA
jgi:hypothetical protein